LISAEAMKLSSSLNPSNVTTATCITTDSKLLVGGHDTPLLVDS
jgi:hypothetical protein